MRRRVWLEEMQRVMRAARKPAHCVQVPEFTYAFAGLSLVTHAVMLQCSMTALTNILQSPLQCQLIR
jgi:hypothetical protein